MTGPRRITAPRPRHGSLARVSALAAFLLVVGLPGTALAGATAAFPARHDGRQVADPPAAACPEGLEVAVPRGLAREEGLAAGDTVRVRSSPEARACPARVSAVYVPRADPARLTVGRPRVLFHLPQLARLVGRDDEVDRFSVRLRPGADAESVVRLLAGLLPGARVLPTGEVTREASTAFEVVRRFHRAIAAITLIAGGVFLACIMILKVEERRGPVAALRLVGISRRTLLGWVALETSAVAVIGGALGVGIGRAAVWAVNRVYRAVYDSELVFALLTPEAVGATLAVGVLLGLGAGLAAGARLFSLRPLNEVGR